MVLIDEHQVATKYAAGDTHSDCICCGWVYMYARKIRRACFVVVIIVYHTVEKLTHPVKTGWAVCFESDKYFRDL
jgi:hypothetical protein